MGEIDYIQDIRGEPGNRIRHRILTDRGQVIDFVVQYETRIDDMYRPVVRYDGSHGHGHRDILNMRGETIAKWWLPDHMDMHACLPYVRHSRYSSELATVSGQIPGAVNMSDVKQAKTVTERDVDLSVAFVNAFYDDVSILDDIPSGSTLVLLPDNDPELAELNLQAGIESVRNGADVYIRHVRTDEKG